MRHSIRLWLLLIGGLAFIGLGLIFSATGLPVRAQDNLEDAEYVGARECASCHRDIARPHEDSPHALALQDVQRKKDGIVADFAQGEDLRLHGMLS